MQHQARYIFSAAHECESGLLAMYWHIGRIVGQQKLPGLKIASKKLYDVGWVRRVFLLRNPTCIFIYSPNILRYHTHYQGTL